MKNDYLISVLIPTYNRASLLPFTIDSVLQQKNVNLELIIINDCSTDNTNDIIEQYDDSRIKYIKNIKNVGSIMGDREHFRRFVYELMQGDYFIYITDDDYWPDECFLEKCIKIFTQYSTLSHIVGSQLSENYENIDELKYYDKNQIARIIQKEENFKQEKWYFFNNLLETGFYKKFDYLEKFSTNATAMNISITGTIFNKEKCLKANFLSSNNPSKWQGGYEYKVTPSLLGDVYFINEPCVVARIAKENASFKFTQIDHYRDQLLSVNNSFKDSDKFFTNKKDYKKIKQIRKKFIKSISQSYLLNSIHIFSGKKLSLNENSNIEKYVTIFLVLKNYIINYILIDKIDLKIFYKYIKAKYK
jgi:glycosyltransferase involved in cell wall biosynthesis